MGCQRGERPRSRPLRDLKSRAILCGMDILSFKKDNALNNKENYKERRGGQVADSLPIE